MCCDFLVDDSRRLRLAFRCPTTRHNKLAGGGGEFDAFDRSDLAIGGASKSFEDFSYER
jgi:hypothetical protein